MQTGYELANTNDILLPLTQNSLNQSKSIVEITEIWKLVIRISEIKGRKSMSEFLLMQH